MRLKWGQTEYKGRLVSVDGYMNIQLSGAEEWVDLKKTGDLGQVLIRCVPFPSPNFLNPLFTVPRAVKPRAARLRLGSLELVCWRCTDRCRCNNVLWIKGADEGDVKMEGDTKMED